MFEEQIKMFDENKQQLDLPFPATHTVCWEQLINPAHRLWEQMALGDHIDGQELITLLL